MFFKSKFAKLEALVATESDKRTPDQLAAAQQELDTAGAGLMLVPKTDTIKSGADLDAHVANLNKEATDAKAAAAASKAAEEKVTKELADLRGSRVMDDQRKESDKQEGGDDQGQQSEAKKAAASVNNKEHKWNRMAEAMGF